jgi:hypothetical protein
LTPAAVTWTGAGDGVSWGDGANWDSGAVPTAADDATVNWPTPVIVEGSAVAHSLQTGGVMQVNGSLSLGADSTIWGMVDIGGGLVMQAGAHLNLTATAQLDGTVQLAAGAEARLDGNQVVFNGTTAFVGDGWLRLTNGANADVEGVLTAQNVSLDPTGTLSGMGTLTVTGALDWTGGPMTGGGVMQITSGATAMIHGPDEKVLDGWTLKDAGQVIWWGADITGMAEELDVQVGGYFEAQGQVSWVDPYGPG